MTPDLTYILRAMEDRQLGLAPHYLTIYSIARGLGARQVLEFGAGMSTRVLLDALDTHAKELPARLDTISTDPIEAIIAKHGLPLGRTAWHHHRGLSRDVLPGLVALPLDLILHDGAHDAETVATDLATALPKLRRYGLALIHDTQHSNCGVAMRQAVRAAREEVRCSAVTLPYGFGLTILRREDGEGAPIDATHADKVTSPHRTVPATV